MLRCLIKRNILGHGPGSFHDPWLRAAVWRAGAGLYLPRYSGDLTEEMAELKAQISEVGAGETVLVIDDEPTVRMLVGKFSALWGELAVSAYSPYSEARSIISRGHKASARVRPIGARSYPQCSDLETRGIFC